MKLYKQDPFGNALFLKKFLIRLIGAISHQRYQGFNKLHIEGSEIIRNLPDKGVLFVSNHQTYFADVAAMMHVFNAALSGRDDSIKNVGYLWQPKLNLYYVTLTNYDDSFKNIHIIFNKDNLSDTLGAVLEKHNKKQIRIAETEKYPHVTFFFSGGRETPFKGETRILRNSPKVATYDLQPEMSANELRDALVPELQKGDVDFVCLNFANGDMVGHTGVMKAAIKACEAVDVCVKDVVTAALENDYTTILIADHGNCETMINPDGSPNTAHTTNPVPIILIDKELKQVNDGVLGDIAPTILKLMGIKQPDAMTRHSLI